MPMLEGLRATELLNYWKDCQLVGFGEVDPEIREQVLSDLIPARLGEVRTELGVKCYQRLQGRNQAA